MSEPTSFTCTLCGARFTHEGRSCSACPLSAGCDLVRCPNCGFQTPRGSRLVAWWRRVAKAERFTKARAQTERAVNGRRRDEA